MKHKNDKRINAGFITFKEYLILFIIVLLACGSYSSVFLLYMKHAPGDPYVFPGAVLGDLLLATLIVAILIGFARRHFFGKPIRRIAAAARKVAAGDFTVRLRPNRKDNKKDEIEILIEDFNKMAEELSTIETLKTDFIANVSHEIKSPLSVIQSYAMAIQDERLAQDERREYGKTIVEAAKKLSVLVTNILKLNKLENQEIFPEPENYALDEQLRECALGFEDLWEKKKIYFGVEIEDDVVVDYDKTLLEIVWNNLISNAIKFTGESGNVMLFLKSEGDFAVVTVKDSGCGMSEEALVHIFDKFYQADTSHATEGNGLGLTLTKKVIDVVGGEIKVESRLNEGTTFTVKLHI